MLTYLITGCAGFIGFSLSKSLLDKNVRIIGLDNLNDYYSIDLKNDRLNVLKEYSNFTFFQEDIKNCSIKRIFKDNKIDVVVNLAAQAGVRYSIDHPEKYIDSNIVGFFNIMECCRNYEVDKLVYASSSSVYGKSRKTPFSEDDNVDNPISLYAATKKSNELIAHTYSSLFNIKTVGLRFFTVYGPWGRPDMALFKFVDKIVKDKPIEIFNHGELSRDFTYIDDIVEGIEKSIDSLFNKDEKTRYRIYNIGNNTPVKLTRFIEIIESKLGKKAIKQYVDMQPGDVPTTYADLTKIRKDLLYDPKVDIELGVEKFISWYLNYYKI